ncbi:hypothetical protein Tco_1136568 [Tanacetum coccineum]
MKKSKRGYRSILEASLLPNDYDEYEESSFPLKDTNYFWTFLRCVATHPLINTRSPLTLLKMEDDNLDTIPETEIG